MRAAIPFHTTHGVIDLADLRDRDMTAAILGDVLAKLPRYNGRTAEPWSVAAHSLVVEHLCPPDLKAWGLLHDAHEAFLGDITTPALELICLHGGSAVQAAVEQARQRLDFAVARAWDCPNRSHSLALQQADWIALQAEMAVFFAARLTGLTQHECQMAVAAVAFINTLPRLKWRAVRDAWVWRAEALAAEGRLTLPAASPNDQPEPHP